MSGVVFTDIKNGRPRFEFGDRAPPPWLIKLADAGKVVNGEFVVNGNALRSGQVVTEPG